MAATIRYPSRPLFPQLNDTTFRRIGKGLRGLQAVLMIPQPDRSISEMPMID
jgi:hypothetical protein